MNVGADDPIIHMEIEPLIELSDDSFVKEQNETLSTNADQRIHGNEVTVKKEYEIEKVFLESDSDGFIWNDETTLLLLEEYQTRSHLFRHPKTKKKVLWQEIMAVFKQNNYTVNEDMLDKKFRNLKQTFMRIRDNQNNEKNIGKGNRGWKYYWIMCEIFSLDKKEYEIERVSLETDSDEFIWNDETTLLLLEEYRTRSNQFRDPKIKKRDLWQQIMAVFKHNNYAVNEDMLDKKFRNLKQTFMRVRDNQNTKKNMAKGNVWKYYWLMCEIFSLDKTINESIERANIMIDDSFTSPTFTVTKPMCELPASCETISPNNCSTRKSNSKADITTTSKKHVRKRLLHHRQELLKVKKKRVNVIRILKKSMDECNYHLKEMVKIGQERNRLLAKLVETQEKRK